MIQQDGYHLSLFGPKFSCEIDLVTKWHVFLKGYPTLKEFRILRQVRFHPAAKLQ